MSGACRTPLRRIATVGGRPERLVLLDGRTGRRSDMPGLDVMVCGDRSSHPTELLSSDRMASLIRETRAKYDFVIVDSPTLLRIADSRILATHVEAVVLVVKSGGTPKSTVKQAQASLRAVSTKVHFPLDRIRHSLSRPRTIAVGR